MPSWTTVACDAGAIGTAGPATGDTETADHLVEHEQCAAVVGERVAQGVELALDVARLDLEVADRGLELGVPVHQALVAVDEAALVELDEGVDHRALVALVHGEALVRPVA